MAMMRLVSVNSGGCSSATERSGCAAMAWNARLRAQGTVKGHRNINILVIIGSRLPPCLQDVMRKLLQRDPAERLGSDCGAEDIKSHPFFAEIQWGLIRNTKPPYLPARVGNVARLNTAFDSF